MREIVSILMRRDGMSENEAWNLIEETKEEIDAAIAADASLDLVEDIIKDYLGLEPDYLDVFLMDL